MACHLAARRPSPLYTARSLPPAPGHSMQPPATAEPALGPYLRAIRAHKPLVILTTLAFVSLPLLWLGVRADADLRGDGEPARHAAAAGRPDLPRPAVAARLRRPDADGADGRQPRQPPRRRAARPAAGDGWTHPARPRLGQRRAAGREQHPRSHRARPTIAELAARLANTFTKETLAVRRDALERDVGPLLDQLRARREALGVVRHRGRRAAGGPHQPARERPHRQRPHALGVAGRRGAASASGCRSDPDPRARARGRSGAWSRGGGADRAARSPHPRRGGGAVDPSAARSSLGFRSAAPARPDAGERGVDGSARRARGVPHAAASAARRTRTTAGVW